MPSSKLPLVVVSIACLGGIAYFLLRKPSDAELRTRIIGLSGSDAENPYYMAVINRMTSQELQDTYTLLKTPLNSRQNVDPALRGRLILISKKYNIFT